MGGKGACKSISTDVRLLEVLEGSADADADLLARMPVVKIIQ